jgi:hypothetical protein
VMAVVFVLPELSVALAVKVCGPFGSVVVSSDELHEVVPDTVVNVPPSIERETLDTDALSDAPPEIVSVPATTWLLVGDVIAIVGGVVSPAWAPAWVVPVTDVERFELFPAASNAETV